jgi:hypothetical protein
MIAIVGGILPSAIIASSLPLTCVHALIESPRPCKRYSTG